MLQRLEYFWFYDFVHFRDSKQQQQIEKQQEPVIVFSCQEVKTKHMLTVTILPLTLLKFSPGWRSLSHQVVTNTSREDRERGSARVCWPAVRVRSAPVPPSGAPSSSSWWNWAPYSCTPDDSPCWRLQPQRRGEKRAVREEEEQEEDEETKCSLDGRFWMNAGILRSEQQVDCELCPSDWSGS